VCVEKHQVLGDDGSGLASRRDLVFHFGKAGVQSKFFVVGGLVSCHQEWK